MILEFKDFEKKVKRKKFLKLNISRDNSHPLAIVDDGNNNLLLRSLQLKEKYKGQIIFKDKDIKEIKNYKPLVVSDYDFYDEFSVYQNLVNLLKIAKVDVNKIEIEEQLTMLELASKTKYKKLTESEKEKLKIYFLTLISNHLILLDFHDSKLEEEDKQIILEFLEDFIAKNEILALVFTKTINEFSSLCEDVIVIADNELAYYGNLARLNVVKELVVVEAKDISEQILENITDIDCKSIGNKIIVRKADLEKIMYIFVTVGVEILSVTDFNENTDLYDVKE